jgi:hypothetical protein
MADTANTTPNLTGLNGPDAAQVLLKQGMRGKDVTDYLAAQGYKDNGLFYDKTGTFGFTGAYISPGANGTFNTIQRSAAAPPKAQLNLPGVTPSADFSSPALNTGTQPVVTNLGGQLAQNSAANQQAINQALMQGQQTQTANTQVF